MVFPSPSSSGAQLALDTILQKTTRGIPGWLLNIMEHSVIERLANVSAGRYRKNPDAVYLAMQRNIGTCLLDQYLADNPLTMGDQGFDPGTQRQATTGAEQIMLDGIFINSPEAVIEHLEKVEFPRLQQAILDFDAEKRTCEIIQGEIEMQEKLGVTMLKSGYGFISFPALDYYKYGYTNYFSAYGLYPNIFERHFNLQADLAFLNNQAAAIAYQTAALPPLYRLDHDMADSRGTLVSLKSLDRLWFPHFARCLEPLLRPMYA